MDSDYLDVEVKSINCPYCGESIEIMIDPSVPFQEYIEDCQVCCRPITMRVEIDHSNPDHPFSTVHALHENEY